MVEHAAGDLVARVQAGARMGDVAAVLARAGQEIALDVPGAATVGGVVASGLAGPRRLRYGTPRDLLIGITIVRADGIVAKSGGKVVKNVAGYDLGKLFAGSAGTLGLITEATFRLHPLPAARAFVTAEYVAVSVACDAVAAAANSPLVASAVELARAAPGGPIQVGVLLEGSADGVAARSARMAACSARARSRGPPDWWPGAPGRTAGLAGLGLARPTAAGGRADGRPDGPDRPAARETLIRRVVLGVGARRGARRDRRGGGRGRPVAGHRGLGRRGPALRARRPPTLLRGRRAAERFRRGQWRQRAADPAVAGFVSGLRAAVGGPRGAVSVLTAPAAVRDQLAGHGGLNGAVPGLALMRAVKDQFDPGHRMAPGRFPEAR